MYGPKWPFLLMYGSHDMRHRFFRRLTGCQRTPGDRGITEVTPNSRKVPLVSFHLQGEGYEW